MSGLRHHPRARQVRLLIQVLGFAISLGLLGVCVWLALKEENRAGFQHLREASAWQVGLLLLLSFLTLNINGLAFWVALRPVRRLAVLDVLATNAVSTFLAYLPFKLSAIARIVIHNRRDRVPLLSIGAWFAAVAVLLLAALGPAALATLWRQKIDALWIIATLGGQVLLGSVIVMLAGAFRGPAGQARLAALAGSLRLRLARRVLGSRAWSNLHAGFDMLASPRAVASAVVLRLADMAVHGSRFALAAAIFGVALPLDQAVLISLTYFMIGVVSPFGVLGAREMGATGMAAALFAGAGGEHAVGMFAAISLLVSASEVIVNLFSAAAGLAWLRLDRLLRGNAPVRNRHFESRAGDGAEAPLPVRAAD
jgi:hypothetical protein